MAVGSGNAAAQQARQVWDASLLQHGGKAAKATAHPI
jgi:hypothetical protein